ncbi:hypothetical protein [Shewanella sp. 0m-4]
MKSTCKLFLYIWLVSLTLGCQSTSVPAWYNSPQKNNSDFIIAVGEGRNLEQAKKSALSNINASLWTEVNSSFSMNDTHRSIGNESYSSAYINNAVNTKTSNIAFSGVEYSNIANNDIYFYAQAQIKKSSVINQLISDLNNINKEIKAQLDKLSHQDPLQWWLINKNSDYYKDYAIVRLAMLSSLSPATKIDTAYIEKITNDSSRVKSSILIYIQPPYTSPKMALMLAEKLSLEGIQTTIKKSPKATHTLKITSSLRQSIIADAYISTQISSLQLINKNNNVISSSEIISTGNSLSNYKISKEGAERHFSTQVDERGLWPALGLTL